MLENFILPDIVPYAITFMLTPCVLAQTLVATMCFSRYPRNRARIFETLAEVLVLGYAIFCSLLFMQAEEGFRTGVLAPPIYPQMRNAFFITIVITVIIAVAFSRSSKMLFAVIVTGLTLPFIEELTGLAFVYIIAVLIIFWLIRCVFAGAFYYKEIKQGISILSVKSAIDSMTTGVMFCRKDGFVLLTNKRMQQLMITITGKSQRNGKHFNSLLTLGDIDPGCRITWFEGQNVCLLPDSSAWMFNKTELPIKNKKYIQLTATDITQRWKLITELEYQSKELTGRQRELNKTLENLHIVSRERATQMSKLRAHDILGERLTMMLRIVRNESTPDYIILRNQFLELLDDLKSSANKLSPHDELNVLIQTFATIGVEITVEGDLFKDNADAQIILKKVTEAVTNAVRNDFATRVIISADNNSGETGFYISGTGQLSDSHQPG
jgi:hypothetical protein